MELDLQEFNQLVENLTARMFHGRPDFEDSFKPSHLKSIQLPNQIFTEGQASIKPKVRIEDALETPADSPVKRNAGCFSCCQLQPAGYRVHPFSN